MLKQLMAKIIIFAFFLTACVNDSNITVSKIPSVKFKRVIVTDGLASFAVICGVSCPSYVYYNYENKIVDEEYLVSFYARLDGQDVCPAVGYTIEVPFVVFIPDPGTYKFHFWQSDTTTLDTTLIIQ